MRDWRRERAHADRPAAAGSSDVDDAIVGRRRVPAVRSRRPTSHPTRSAGVGSVVRAAAGAAIAVTGVAVGLGALLLLRGEPGGTPALDGPLAAIDETIPYEDLDTSPAPSPTQVFLTPPGVTLSPTPRSPVASPPPVPRTIPPSPRVVRLPLTVLNNSRYSGLAARAAAKFRAAGWPIRETGNAGGRFRTTTVYYAPGQRAAAEALARRFPDIRRVLPRFAELPGRGLTVVVTRDFDV